MTSQSERKCLIVLGMHRSGTSALSGALELTGYDLGKTIMPPAPENPKGFFENMQITTLNVEILDELFVSWNDTLFIPEDWWKFDKFIEFADKIKYILQEEFSGEKPMLIKDPRISILLPLYLNVFNQSGIKPVFVICARNPFEVANSLKKRNNISKEKSFLLWMDYQLKAELYTRNLPRTFVSNAGFLTDPMKTIHSINDALNLDMIIDNQTEQEILSFVDPVLSYKMQQARNPEYDQIPELFEFFNLLINADLRDLTIDEMNSADRIRSRFYNMTRFYNGFSSNYEATLTVNLESNEKIVLTAPVHYGRNDLEFTVSPDIMVTGMVLRPCNSRVVLKILKKEVLLSENSVSSLDNIATNAGHINKDGLMSFDTDLPRIVVSNKLPISVNRIVFLIEYLAFGTISSRKALWKPGKPVEKPQVKEPPIEKKSDIPEQEYLKMKQLVNDQKLELEEKSYKIEQLNKLLVHNDLQVKKIKKSLTWKIGRIITAPAGFIFRRTNSANK